jgi:hypothetical protein
VSFAAITFYVASQRVFIVVAVVYFVIDSVRKFLDIPSYADALRWTYLSFKSCTKMTFVVSSANSESEEGQKAQSMERATLT